MRIRELIICLVAVLATGSAVAADSDYSSFISPFATGDRYRLVVIGDSLAAGLVQPLSVSLGPQGVEVVNKTATGLGLARGDGNEWDKVIDTLPATEVFQIAVIQFGVDDRIGMRAGNRQLGLGSDVWLAEYTRRTDALLKALHARNIAVYWLGLPIMRTGPATNAAQIFNGIFAERVRLSGAKYIESWGGFVDADGAFTEQGPDMAGIVKPLRLPDGIHMTPAGYQKFANYIDREVTHDLAAARRERDVPLAGDEAEQQNVRDETLPRKSDAPALAAGKPAKTSKSAKDYPADDGSVVVATGADGTATTMPLVRPAIPGAVLVELLASRAAKQSELGHSMSADLMGGFTVMSSIATSLDAAGGPGQQLPLTENPFYKLLIRGDPLPAKPGRADDFSWPRPGGVAAGEPSG